ncbi:MAG TPA: CPBP family intramembrane glutamic endopeptidase [Candidatus Limnocylindrales bacterium]
MSGQQAGAASGRAGAVTWAGPAVLLVIALLPALRPAGALALAVCWVLLRLGRRPEAIAWAAVLPVALVLPWPAFLGADPPLGESGCVDPLSVIALRRVAVGLFGLAVVAALARSNGSGARELGLRRPRGIEATVALAAVAVVAAGGLWIGPWLARPFFGRLDFPTPVAALVPALAFGVANGILEEVSYRGAMQAWLGRAMPFAWAVVLQGLAFGIVHAGPEVLALLPVHIAVMGAVGIVGGLARERLGSLWLPVGVHVGADIALYVGLACRAAG